ncbi:glycine-rich RNA-binding protein 4, mitochondrial [Mangifera indica]|uniref:glycine-rich RNA-binding protein 4, mitochondrial n=1 Tax=Mangifera indica TaxID=29780 RepID=UPI001CF9D1DD|nr:glycine-rich RNA-binding protein 4, mitochondrial [Mangifera indica]
MKNSIALTAKRVMTSLSSSNSSTLNLRSYCSSSSHSSSSSPPPNAKLFVAGLSWSVDEKSLKDAFSSFGDVTEVRIIYDKDSGRSRGFGFVHFSKEDDAESARNAMDGKALLGRPLRISFALERVRGEPIVVPRLTNAGEFTNRNKRTN